MVWELLPLEEVMAMRPRGHAGAGLSLDLGAGYVGVFCL